MNASWFRHLVQIAPWLTLVLLVAMFLFLQNAMAPVPSLAFELPDSGAADAAAPGLVALLLPGDVGGTQAEGSLLFFDDDRYALSDAAGVNEFAERLVRRATEAKCGVLTLLCDRRVPAGDVMQVMALVRKRGLVRVQLAEKQNQ